MEKWSSTFLLVAIVAAMHGYKVIDSGAVLAAKIIFFVSLDLFAIAFTLCIAEIKKDESNPTQVSDFLKEGEVSKPTMFIQQTNITERKGGRRTKFPSHLKKRKRNMVSGYG